MSYTIEGVADAGNDVLVVSAVDADGNEVVTQGFVSATTRFYDPKDVDAHRMPKKGAIMRAMTPAEVGAYALALIEGRDYFEDIYPIAPTSAPTPIAFK